MRGPTAVNREPLSLFDPKLVTQVLQLPMMIKGIGTIGGIFLQVTTVESTLQKIAR